MRLVRKMTVALVVAAGAASAVPAALEGGPEMVSLSSSYLTVPVEMDGASAHAVSIVGEIGGRATLMLDPNMCSLNLFGDPQICTRMAVFPRTVWLQKIELPDPLGLGRHLYDVHGLEGPEKCYLVVPRERDEPHLFIQTDDAGFVSRVVPLD